MNKNHEHKCWTQTIDLLDFLSSSKNRPYREYKECADNADEINWSSPHSIRKESHEDINE
jgi:hypothetical protein